MLKGRQLRYTYTTCIKKKTGFVSEQKGDIYWPSPVTDVDAKSANSHAKQTTAHPVKAD